MGIPISAIAAPALQPPFDQYIEYPSTQGEAVDIIVREVIETHEEYTERLVREINGHVFDFDSLEKHFFAPGFSSVANLELGSISHVRGFLEALAKLVSNEQATMSPVRTRYPSCNLIQANVAVVFAIGELDILLPDGACFSIEMRATNVLAKTGERWVFHNVCDQSTFTVTQEGSRKLEEYFIFDL